MKSRNISSFFSDVFPSRNSRSARRDPYGDRRKKFDRSPVDFGTEGPRDESPGGERTEIEKTSLKSPHRFYSVATSRACPGFLIRCQASYSKPLHCRSSLRRSKPRGDSLWGGCRAFPLSCIPPSRPHSDSSSPLVWSHASSTPKCPRNLPIRVLCYRPSPGGVPHSHVVFSGIGSPIRRCRPLETAPKENPRGTNPGGHYLIAK